jgi:hypothetical protein
MSCGSLFIIIAITRSGLGGITAYHGGISPRIRSVFRHFQQRAFATVRGRTARFSVMPRMASSMAPFPVASGCESFFDGIDSVGDLFEQKKR